MMDKVVQFLSGLAMRTINNEILRGIHRTWIAVDRNELPSRVIYEALQRNSLVMSFIAQLDINVRHELIKLLSDQRFREWLVKNIDDLLNYIILLIKQTLPPEPELK